MGKFDGKHITGMVGNLVFRTDEKETIVQTAPATVKQTEATKKAASIFGQGSILASGIRSYLNYIITSQYDRNMINRLNSPVKSILRHCYDKETDQFNFTADSFNRLAGFEFNTKSLLANSLWVQPKMSLTANSLNITIPEIEVPAQLKFPDTGTLCELTVIVSFIILDQALRKQPSTQSLIIDNIKKTIPAQELTFEVPDGCLCVVGLGLKYYSVYNEIKQPLNSKTFNPAGIIGAIITPGIFVNPGPTIISPNHVRAAEWTIIPDMALKSR